MELRVLSWNVHGLPRPLDLHFLPWDKSPRHAERVRHVLARVREVSPLPDVLAFQEVWRDDDAAAIMAMPGFVACEAPNGPIMRPTGLLTLVRRDRWTIEKCEMHPYAQSANTDTHGKKGLLVAKLKHTDGSVVTFINTHLQSQYATSGEKTYSGIRASQIETLTQKATTYAMPGVPLIACGDFNTYPYPSDAAVYEGISNGRPWIDLTRNARARCGCETNFDSVHPGKMDGWIDYALAFADPNLRFVADITLLTNSRIDVPYSDHQGLLATISMTTVKSQLALGVLGLALAGRPSTRRQWLAGVVATLDGARPRFFPE